MVRTDHPLLRSLHLDERPLRRNVVIRGSRTTVSATPSEWASLEDIVRREKLSLGDLCEIVDSRRGDAALVAGLRVFALAYWRSALQGAGHAGGVKMIGLAEEAARYQAEEGAERPPATADPE